jgi:hypothetical protein
MSPVKAERCQCEGGASCECPRPHHAALYEIERKGKRAKVCARCFQVGDIIGAPITGINVIAAGKRT